MAFLVCSPQQPPPLRQDHLPAFHLWQKKKDNIERVIFFSPLSLLLRLLYHKVVQGRCRFPLFSFVFVWCACGVGRCFRPSPVWADEPFALVQALSVVSSVFFFLNKQGGDTRGRGRGRGRGGRGRGGSRPTGDSAPAPQAAAVPRTPVPGVVQPKEVRLPCAEQGAACVG